MIPLTVLVLLAWWKYDEVSMKSARMKVPFHNSEDPREVRLRKRTLSAYAKSDAV